MSDGLKMLVKEVTDVEAEEFDIFLLKIKMEYNRIQQSKGFVTEILKAMFDKATFRSEYLIQKKY